MKVKLSILVLTLLVILAGAATAQTGCDDLEGNAYGLCIAYCEAMDCDSPDHQASERACDRVFNNFMDLTLTAPPCACPCLLGNPPDADFASFVDGDYDANDVTCWLDGSLDGEFSLMVFTSAEFFAEALAVPEDNEGSCGSSTLAPVGIHAHEGAACGELLKAAFETATAMIMGECVPSPPPAP